MVAEELGRDNDVSKLLEKPLILGPAESRVNRTLYPLPLSAITVFGKFEGDAHRTRVMYACNSTLLRHLQSERLG
jgi:hypothetical protein